VHSFCLINIATFYAWPNSSQLAFVCLLVFLCGLVLGFELGIVFVIAYYHFSHTLHSFLALVIFQRKSGGFAWWPQSAILPFSTFQVAEITGMGHHVQPQLLKLAYVLLI
jgi:hypothetical protein